MVGHLWWGGRWGAYSSPSRFKSQQFTCSFFLPHPTASLGGCIGQGLSHPSHMWPTHRSLGNMQTIIWPPRVNLTPQQQQSALHPYHWSSNEPCSLLLWRFPRQELHSYALHPNLLWDFTQTFLLTCWGTLGLLKSPLKCLALRTHFSKFSYGLTLSMDEFCHLGFSIFVGPSPFFSSQLCPGLPQG